MCAFVRWAVLPLMLRLFVCRIDFFKDLIILHHLRPSTTINNKNNNHQVPWDKKDVERYPKNTRSRFSLPDNTRLIKYKMQIPVPDPYPIRPEIFFPIPEPEPSRNWKPLPVGPCWWGRVFINTQIPECAILFWANVANLCASQFLW